MPSIRFISDLRNNSNERQQAQLELYFQLAEAEVEILSGAEGVDFFEFARKLRDDVHGTI